MTARIKSEYDCPNQVRPNQVRKDRANFVCAVIDRTYSRRRNGAPKSLNIEHVGAVYDRPNQVRPNQVRSAFLKSMS